MNQNNINKFIYPVFLFLVFTLIFSCAINKRQNIRDEYGLIRVELDFIPPANREISLAIEKIKFRGAFTGDHEISIKKTIVLNSESKQLILDETNIPSDSYRGVEIFISEAFELKEEGVIKLESQYTKIPFRIDTPYIIKPGKKQSLQIKIPLFIIKEGERDILVIEPGVKKEYGYKGLRGAKAYVTNEADNDVLVFDRLNWSVLGRIEVGEAPRGIIISNDKSKLYVANSGSNSISVIDTIKNQVTETIFLGLGIEPEGIAITPDGRKIITANKKSNNVSIIDTYSNRIIDHINVGQSPSRISIGPWGEEVYVTNSESNDITIINWKYDIHTINVQSEPIGIKGSKDGDKLFVACRDSDALIMIDTERDRIYNTITAEGGPTDIIMDEQRGRIYVANYWSNNISVFIESLEIKETAIPAGKNPISMAIDNSRELLYIVNHGDNTISVVNTINQVIESTIEVGNRPWGIVLD